MSVPVSPPLACLVRSKVGLREGVTVLVSRKGEKVEVCEGALIVAKAVSVFSGLLGVMVGDIVAVGGVPVTVNVGVLLGVGELTPLLVAVAPPPPPLVAVGTTVLVAVAVTALTSQQDENSEVSVGVEPSGIHVAVAVM